MRSTVQGSFLIMILFFRSQTSDGSLPIHLACQYSSDPTLLVNLLYYDKSVVNFERTDGFTPLHLVAARADMQDVPLGLIRLDEDTQVKTLFEMNVSNYRIVASSNACY